MIKSILKWFAIIVGAIVSVAAIWIASFVYEIKFKVEDIASYISDDGRYSVLIQTVGEPVFFGPSTARVIVYGYNADGKAEKLEQFETAVYDDGGSLQQEDCTVQWRNSSVKIIFTGCEQDDAVYEIQLK